MKKPFKINIQLFADESEKDTSQEQKTPENTEPNPLEDIKKNYEDRINKLEAQNIKLQQQVKDYSDFLKTAPLKTEQPKKASQDIISEIIKGGRF